MAQPFGSHMTTMEASDWSKNFIADLAYISNFKTIISLVIFFIRALFQKKKSENPPLGSPSWGAAPSLRSCIFLGDFSCLSWASITCKWAEIIIGVRACGSKLARGIDHLWSWVRFMATQNLVINFPNRASWQKLWPKF